MIVSAQIKSRNCLNFCALRPRVAVALAEAQALTTSSSEGGGFVGLLKVPFVREGFMGLENEYSWKINVSLVRKASKENKIKSHKSLKSLKMLLLR